MGPFSGQPLLVDRRYQPSSLHFVSTIALPLLLLLLYTWVGFFLYFVNSFNGATSSSPSSTFPKSLADTWAMVGCMQGKGVTALPKR